MFSARPSIQGKWTQDLWNLRPKHELEIPKIFPLYLTDMTPFKKDKAAKEIRNAEQYKQLLNSKSLNPTLVHKSI